MCFNVVVCYTCGSVLGDKSYIYRTELMKKIDSIRNGKNIATTKILTDPTINIDMIDVLNKLGIDSDCCRLIMISSMDIRDWY